MVAPGVAEVVVHCSVKGQARGEEEVVVHCSVKGQARGEEEVVGRLPPQEH